MTIPRDIHAAEPAFSYEARINGATLRFSRLIRGVGEARDIILCATNDGQEVAVLASEWSRDDRCGASRGRLGTVTRTSSDSQKIALYRSLFRGREDAYAAGYLRKDGRMGYSPACSNAWKPVCAIAAAWGATSAATEACTRWMTVLSSATSNCYERFSGRADFQN